MQLLFISEMMILIYLAMTKVILLIKQIYIYSYDTMLERK